MRTEVVMPQMGESVAEGTVTRWFKEVGERVERDEPLFEITTDKVDAEVEAPADGVLIEIRVEPGETVEVNSVVAILDAEAEEGAVAEPPTAAADEEPQSQPQEPRAAETTDAEPSPAPSPTRSAVAAGSRKTNGSRGLGTPASEFDSLEQLRRVRSTPLVRRIAQEHGIRDLSPIPGSGLSGRVTKEDIVAWIDEGRHERPPGQPAGAERVPGARREIHRPEVQIGERDRVDTLSPQRQMIARHMLGSREISAHAHTVHEVEFTQVVQHREKNKAEFADRDARLTYTAYLVKAAAEALAEYPMVNSSMLGDDQMVYRGDINVGIAVDVGGSLIVPVVENVDELSLLGVARAVSDLAERARNKRLKPHEVKGGTFTISNHGVFGPEFGVPIINQPQTAIISTGAIKKRVVADQQTGAILVKPTSIWCLSFDHRVIDGATADKFMAKMREVIETWE